MNEKKLSGRSLQLNKREADIFRRAVAKVYNDLYYFAELFGRFGLVNSEEFTRIKDTANSFFEFLVKAERCKEVFFSGIAKP